MNLSKFKISLRIILKPLFIFIRLTIESFIKIKKYILYYILPEKEYQHKVFHNCYDMFAEEQILKCYQKFSPFFLSSIFLSAKKIREYSVKKALENFSNKGDFFYLELGVFLGSSINLFAKIIKDKKIYGFDSFEGLKNDWHGTDVEKGEFSLHGNLPKVEKNVILYKGWVEDTLEPFLNEKRPKIAFVHFDLDTYSSTLYSLKKIKPYLSKGSIMLFDEFYNYPGWSVGEYKALNEVFNSNEYKILAFCKDGWSATIEVL